MYERTLRESNGVEAMSQFCDIVQLLCDKGDLLIEVSKLPRTV